MREFYGGSGFIEGSLFVCFLCFVCPAPALTSRYGVDGVGAKKNGDPKTKVQGKGGILYG